MFLEAKQAGESQVREPSLEGFIAWLKTMPQDGVYDWESGSNCACAQYAQSIGLGRNWQAYCDGRLYASRHVKIWTELNRIAMPTARNGSLDLDDTFGACLRRAQAKA